MPPTSHPLSLSLCPPPLLSLPHPPSSPSLPPHVLPSPLHLTPPPRRPCFTAPQGLAPCTTGRCITVTASPCLLLLSPPAPATLARSKTLRCNTCRFASRLRASGSFLCPPPPPPFAWAAHQATFHSSCTPPPPSRTLSPPRTISTRGRPTPRTTSGLELPCPGKGPSLTTRPPRVSLHHPRPIQPSSQPSRPHHRGPDLAATHCCLSSATTATTAIRMDTGPMAAPRIAPRHFSPPRTSLPSTMDRRI